MTLRLLPTARIGDAIAALNSVSLDAGNLRGGALLGYDIAQAYGAWVLNAERTLCGQFVTASVADQLFTSRYWHLMSVAYVDGQRFANLVHAELDQQTSALRAEHARLTADEKRWQRGQVVVLDTSALIHGSELSSWDAAETLSIRHKAIHLVIPILVLDELDGLKESTKPFTRTRTRETLRYIADQLGTSHVTRIREATTQNTNNRATQAAGEVFLELLLDEPGHRRLPIADDEIVDRASTIATAAGRDVILMTNDDGQAHRANLAGLIATRITNPIYDVDLREEARARKLEKDAVKNEQRALDMARHQQRGEA